MRIKRVISFVVIAAMVLSSSTAVFADELQTGNAAAAVTSETDEVNWPTETDENTSLTETEEKQGITEKDGENSPIASGANIIAETDGSENLSDAGNSTMDETVVESESESTGFLEPIISEHSETERTALVYNNENTYAIRPLSAGDTSYVYRTGLGEYPNGVPESNYGYWRVDVNGQTYIAACVTASLSGAEGTYTVYELTNDALKAAILMLPGNYLYEHLVSMGQIGNYFESTTSVEDRYMFMHIAASVIYSGDYAHDLARWSSSHVEYINSLVAVCQWIASLGGVEGFNLDDYVLYIVNQNNTTQAVAWVEKAVKSSISIKKSSADTSITSGNANYSLAGAVYNVYSSYNGGAAASAKDGVYTGGSLSGYAGSITTNANGEGTLSNLPIGTYYIKEATAPSGYALDNYIYEVVTSSSAAEVTLNVTDEPITTRITLAKSSADEDITAGNENYSLAGAVYTVYSNAACTDIAGTITTDKDGQGSLSGLAIGTYYIKETKAPAGYEPDDTVYSVTTSSTNTNITLNVEDDPLNYPADILIIKTWDGDKTGTLPSLAGTLFTLTFYGGEYDSIDEAETAAANNGIEKRTWVIEVKYNASEDRYETRLSDLYKISGDDFFYDGDIPVLPLGTLVIEETKAAPGYSLSGSFYDVDGNLLAEGAGEDEGFVYITHIAEGSNGAYLVGGNEFVSYDTPVNGQIKLIKSDTDGMPIEGASFVLTDSFGNRYTAVSDGNGEAYFTDLYPDVYTLVEAESSDGKSLLSQEITIEIPISMIEEEAVEAGLDTSEEGVIYVPETSDTEGNVTSAHYLILNQTYEISNGQNFVMPAAGSMPLWSIPLAGCMFAGCSIFVLFRKKAK